MSDSATPWTAARQASLSLTISRSLPKFMSMIQWRHPIISSSVGPFSSCSQSFLASGSLPVSWLFVSGGEHLSRINWDIFQSQTELIPSANCITFKSLLFCRNMKVTTQENKLIRGRSSRTHSERWELLVISMWVLVDESNFPSYWCLNGSFFFFSE